MESVSIRRASTDDASAVAAIYNHYVRTSTFTFDVAEKSVDDRREWLAAHGDSHPVLVAERRGHVVGFSSVSPYATRPAWSRTVEVGVYVAPDETGSGLGPQLLSVALESARAAGHHTVIAQIEAGNAASLKLAERAGFARKGTLDEVGYKFDRWLDVVMLQLTLDGREA